MKAIWKFELSIKNLVTLVMPKDAEILSFQVQADTPCIWAIVDVDEEVEDRKFQVVGTGHEFEKVPGRYIGTAQMLDGRLVWHLFEIKEIK